MKKTILIIKLIVCTLIWNISNGQTVDRSTYPIEQIEETLQIEISKILIETGMPSVSFVLIKDSIVLSKTYGFANIKNQVLATNSTIYNTGSNFKFVTATAIMILAEDGKLDIDDPVNKYLDQYAINDMDEDGLPVTIRHLLCHHAGLTGPIETVPLWERKLPSNLEDVVSEIEVIEKPGERFSYCNHCYALLGFVIEKVSGEKFQDYIVNHILKPLSILTDSPLTPSPKMVEDLALPYTLVNNNPIPENQIRFNVFPAGDMYLTTTDMAKFLCAQMNNGIYNGQSVLSEESISEMQEPQFDGPYGLGTGVLIRDGEKILTHTGGLPGFSSYFKIWVNSKIGVYLSSNCGEAHEILDAIASLSYKLLSGVNEIDPLKSFAKSEFVKIELTEDILLKYVGVYQFRPGMNISITLDNSQLFAQVSGQEEHPIYPYENNKFFFKVAYAQIEFITHEDGEISLKLLQNGEHAAIRIE